MGNPQKNIRQAIESTKGRLEILEEIDLLDSEFRLIENEYTQRRKQLEDRLAKLKDE